MTKEVRKRATTFMLTQQLAPDDWHWSAQEKQAFDQGADAVMQVLGQRLTNGLAKDAADAKRQPDPFKFAGILHDADTTYGYDPKTQSKVIVPKTPHIHVVLMFDKRQDLDKIAQWAGLEPQYVEVPNRGKYGRENMLAYLIHAKSSDKYQYQPTAVQTFGTFDYMDYYYKHQEAWASQLATRTRKANTVKADWLAKQVQRGDVTKEQILLTNDYAEVYADNMRLINDAFQFYGEKKGYETLQALKNHEFEMSVIFITGAPRMGKTYFARGLIDKLLTQAPIDLKQQWRSYSAADTNPMDDYAGEEVVFMDDLRSSAMTPSAWLKLLDPINISPTGARYHNKMVAPRVIILTSYMDPYTFFGFMRGTAGTNEALEQFIGRLSMLARIVDLADPQTQQQLLDRTTDTRAVIANDIVQTDRPVNMVIGQPKLLKTPRNGQSAEYSTVNRETSYADRTLYTTSFNAAQNRIVEQIMAQNNPHTKHFPQPKPVVSAYATNAPIGQEYRMEKAQYDQRLTVANARRMYDINAAYAAAIEEDKARVTRTKLHKDYTDKHGYAYGGETLKAQNRYFEQLNKRLGFDAKGPYFDRARAFNGPVSAFGDDGSDVAFFAKFERKYGYK